MNPQEALALMPAATIKANYDYSEPASLTRGKPYVAVEKSPVYEDGFLSDLKITVKDDEGRYVPVSCACFDF